MDDAGTELADRIRALFGGDLDIEEKRMFGSRAFLVDGRILVGARKQGVLLVRVVSDEQSAALLLREGATRAIMGARTMSAGWIDVDPQAITDDDALLFWLDAAREGTS